METEIELKFFVSPEYVDVLHRKLSEFKVHQHRIRHLENTYFDTPDNWLRRHDIGLRIRKIDDIFIQTVKTSGRVVAGLHQRPEFNAEHDCNTPLLSLHPAQIWPQGRELATLETELCPVFSTNFTREQWLIGMSDGAQIEVAFDQGTVQAGDQESPICEVELELKSGQTDALFTLARTLSDEGGMRLGNQSKAQRGYQLATGYTGAECKSLPLLETSRADSIESCFIRSLEHGMAHLNWHEQVFIESHDLNAMKEMNHAVYFLHQTLAVYQDVVPKRASTVLRQELKWLEQELSWLKEHERLERFLADKGHALRKLDARKALIKALKHQQTDLPDIEDMMKLLHSGRYTGLILDLSRWVLTRGWQPFLDENAKEKLAEPIKPFSSAQLEQAWQALMAVFPESNPLTSEEYLSYEYRLMRNLFTGIGFATLYDEEERQAFRLPWLDLYHGIDDLSALQPLKALVDSLAGDEQEQLIRWIARKESSILHAMEQTRGIIMGIAPYWKVQ